MIKRLGLKKWELALALAVGFTLLYGVFWGGTECFAWWGTVYPELTGEAGAYLPVSSGVGDGVVIRFRIAEWIAALLQRLRG